MGKQLDLENVPEYRRVIDYIDWRFRKGQYTLILMGGKTGTGKSWSGLRLCEVVSERLGTEFRVSSVCTDLLSFVKAVMNSKPGECVLLEEVSVLFPSRRAMAADNVAIGQILDTCRKKRLIIIANCPGIKTADSFIRNHTSIYLETININKTLEICTMKAYRYEVNVRSQKPYFHRFRDKGIDIHRVYSKKPSELLIEEYEKSKSDFMENLYESIKAKVMKAKDKEIRQNMMGQEMTFAQNLTPREKDVFPLHFLQKKNNIEIGKILGLTNSRVSRIVRQIRSKIKISEKTESSTNLSEGEQ